jgi:hypothetical protein
MHFSQLCTYERCKGYWALRFDDGRFGDVALGGLRAVVVFDTPQRMIDGQWIQRLIVDSSASPEARWALETLVNGEAGGPWGKLAAFVGSRQPTEYRPITMIDEGATKRLSIAGRLTAVVNQIRGRDRSKPVVFENIFNQIHASTQVIALGDSEYRDDAIVISNAGSHGLYSMFEWSVGGPPR